MVMPVTPSFVFHVTSQAEPGAISRVLEFFALNDLIPDELSAHRTPADEMRMELSVAGLDYTRARVIAAKIKQLVVVSGVTLFAATRLSVAGGGGSVRDLREMLV